MVASTGSWWDWAPAAIQVGGILVGSSMSANANVQAAKIAAQAQQQATAAQLQSQAQAREILAGQQAAASPGLTAVQQTIRRGAALTPLQQQQISDARAQTVNSISPGLRGSGAATVAAVRKVEDGLTKSYMDTNQKGVDSAASGLSGQYFSAGNNTVNSLTNSGNSISSGLTAVGDINANAGLKTADNSGRAIGDIGAVIADQLREQNRPKVSDQKIGETIH